MASICFNSYPGCRLLIELLSIVKIYILIVILHRKNVTEMVTIYNTSWISASNKITMRILHNTHISHYKNVTKNLTINKTQDDKKYKEFSI